MISDALRTVVPQRRPLCRQPARERGVVLFITLIVLVAMTLAAIATVRSVDTTIQIAGNLAFRQSTTLGADRAIEAARDWLLTQTDAGVLFDSNPDMGYYAFVQTSGPGQETPWSEYDWENQSRAVAGTDAAGNTVRYVIQRMCDQPGNPNNLTGGSCLSSTVTAGGASGSSMAAGRPSVFGFNVYYYRITAQVIGPRNTVSYVQAMIEL